MHPDHLGTPRVVADAAGVTVWRWDNLEPFGLTGVQTDPDGNGQAFVFNLRFAGQYFDAESGLFHNRHRDYDSASGRYVQADPMGLAGGISLYSYVGANPLGFVDPLGLARCSIQDNASDGRGRELRVQKKLESAFPQSNVQRESYLRNADGSRAIDPVSGEARRIDHAVIENGQARYLVETTSKTADKSIQLGKESSIRDQGSVYIRNRSTGGLVDVSNVPTRVVRIK